MNDPLLTSRERLLLDAALNPDAGAAAAGWQRWSEQVVLEEAPDPELRLLPKVYAHLSRIAPETLLPLKLRGKARATFARNQAITHAALPSVQVLAEKVPVMAIKGLATCAAFDAWSSRPMGDSDILVPLAQLPQASAILRQLGWTPKYGMTWASLQHRAPFRRDSWNLMRGQGDLDLHWRFPGRAAGGQLERALWAGSRSIEVHGGSCRIPGAEYSVAAALEHGFRTGTRGDLLQAIVDCAAWLPLSNIDRLASLLSAAGLWDAYGALDECLRAGGQERVLPVGLQQCRRGANRPARRIAAAPSEGIEKPVLRSPLLYRIWTAMGRRPRLERLLIRWFGPFSRPLDRSAEASVDYDLRECAVIDRIGGPGWGWPEPEHTCFWCDGADNRLLLPLTVVDDHVAVLTLAANRGHSRNRAIDVYANGTKVASFTMILRRSDYAIPIPAHSLSGPWVELAFRPEPYLGCGAAGRGYGLRRSLPASRLQLFRATDLPEIPACQSDIPRSPPADDEVRLARFERARRAIEVSPYRDDPRIPAEFDPELYLLVHTDVLDAEVDPYRHFLEWGMQEGRVW